MGRLEPREATIQSFQKFTKRDIHIWHYQVDVRTWSGKQLFLLSPAENNQKRFHPSIPEKLQK